MTDKVLKSDAEWRSALSTVAYEVLRGKGTEQAFAGAYTDEKRKGVYVCAGCAQELFDSETKFDSGTGWPSFFKPVSEECLLNEEDRSVGMLRTEVMCGRCEGHLGHVFEDGPQPTGLRYCINSVSLKLLPKDAE